MSEEEPPKKQRARAAHQARLTDFQDTLSDRKHKIKIRYLIQDRSMFNIRMYGFFQNNFLFNFVWRKVK